MRYAFGSQTRARAVALALLGLVLVGCVVFFRAAVDPQKSRIPGFDLSGEWEFHNGFIQGDPAKQNFADRVIVPDPLPTRISTNLKSEFWYRKRFIVPSEFRRTGVLLYLGSVKGAHEVYWNKRFLGAGGDTSLGIYRIPESYISSQEVTLLVKVTKSSTIFPGIVNMNGVVIGDAGASSGVLNQYYFDTGVKPLLPASIKLSLFAVFMALFIAVPYKREYFSFSIFSLFSGLSSAFYSRFIPGYDDYYFRNSFIFFFFVISMGLIPMMTVDMLRLPERWRSLGRCFGFSLSIVFLLAALLVSGPSQELNVFRLANSWIPAISLLFSAVAGFFFACRLNGILKHRKYQIIAFSSFLILGMLAFGSGISSFMTFRLFQFRTFFDLVVSMGLGVSLGLDFRLTDIRSRRASKTIPKWFSGFLSGGVDHIKMELPLVVLAVDTAGYTKQLAGLSERERDVLHSTIREKLAELMHVSGAQKISERGDGGIFAWDFPDVREARSRVLEEVLSAAIGLNETVGKAVRVVFRVGISAGMVRGELRNGDISFLGEALNVASRLESIAEPGGALIDASLAAEISESVMGKGCVVAELKGVTYRARPLQKAA
jgi:class 3 adenylate cyclase